MKYEMMNELIEVFADYEPHIKWNTKFLINNDGANDDIFKAIVYLSNLEFIFWHSSSSCAVSVS